MSVFPMLLLGLTLWLVNGSPTPKSPEEPSWVAREPKQILLPMHFPGQFADFNDYVVPSIQTTGYTIHNGQLNTYNHVDPPANVYRHYYGFNPFYMAPVVPQGRYGFAALASFFSQLFGGGGSSSSSSSTTSSSSSSSSSSTTSSTPSSSTSSTTSSTSSTTSSTSSTASSSSSTSGTTSRAAPVRTVLFVPVPAIVTATRMP